VLFSSTVASVFATSTWFTSNTKLDLDHHKPPFYLARKMASSSSGSAVSSIPDKSALGDRDKENQPSANIDAANAPVEKEPEDSSKLKTFLGLLRK